MKISLPKGMSAVPDFTRDLMGYPSMIAELVLTRDAQWRAAVDAITENAQAEMRKLAKEIGEAAQLAIAEALKVNP